MRKSTMLVTPKIRVCTMCENVYTEFYRRSIKFELCPDCEENEEKKKITRIKKTISLFCRKCQEETIHYLWGKYGGKTFVKCSVKKCVCVRAVPPEKLEDIKYNYHEEIKQ